MSDNKKPEAESFSAAATDLKAWLYLLCNVSSFCYLALYLQSVCWSSYISWSEESSSCMSLSNSTCIRALELSSSLLSHRMDSQCITRLYLRTLEVFFVEAMHASLPLAIQIHSGMSSVSTSWRLVHCVTMAIKNLHRTLQDKVVDAGTYVKDR